jgi:hypothetical protein
MSRSPGSGNAAWKASRIMTRCKPGNVNRKTCSVIRRDGSKCHAIAVKNFERCFHHGGSGVLARRGLYRPKLRYLAWSEPRAQLKSEAQLRDEAKTKLAALSEFPVGKDM